MNKLDYLGQDCIAVTDRIAVSWPFYHYAVELIKGCCPDEGKEKDYQEVIGEDVTSDEKVELLNIMGFTAERFGRHRVRGGNPNRNPRYRTGWRRVALSPNGISFVHYDVYEKPSRKFINVFDGSPDEVKQKWMSIKSSSQSYQYAEQGKTGSRIDPEEVTSFTNFPYSLYRAFGNNSNTFVRHVVTSAGIEMTEISGSHPGNNSPDPNDFDWDNWRNPKAGW